jgi:hypothetical protein
LKGNDLETPTLSHRIPTAVVYITLIMRSYGTGGVDNGSCVSVIGLRTFARGIKLEAREPRSLG